MEDALTKEIKFSPAISLPFHELEPRNLAFSLPLGPGKRQTGLNSGFISPKPSGQASEFGGLACQGVFYPRRKQGGRVLSEQAEEAWARS